MPSRLDEPNAENPNLSDLPSTTVVALSTTVSAKGSKVLSKLSHSGVDSLCERADGDWQIRTRSHNQGIEVPGALELRGSSLESRYESQAAAPSSIRECQSQQRIGKGFSNRAKGA